MHVSKHLSPLSHISDKVNYQAEGDHVELVLLFGGDGVVEEAVLLDVFALRMQVDVGSVDPAVLGVSGSGDGAYVEDAELGHIAIVRVDAVERLDAPLARGGLAGFSGTGEGPSLVLGKAAERVETFLDDVLLFSSFGLLELLQECVEFGDLLGVLGGWDGGCVAIDLVLRWRFGGVGGGFGGGGFGLAGFFDGGLLDFGLLTAFLVLDTASLASWSDELALLASALG